MEKPQLTRIQLDCLIDHLIKNMKKKTKSDKDLIIFYKEQRKKLMTILNKKIHEELEKI